jgi:SAM-dependent methyltransferase
MRAVDQSTAETSFRRLNLGCGFDHWLGSLNVDFQEFHQPDLKADVRDLPMLSSDTYEEALAVDVLEHVERGDVVRALREWRRVLKPGESLHIRTSDLISFAHLMVRRDAVADHHQLIQCLFGTNAYKGDYHLAGFTDLTLIDHLLDAGFDQGFHEIESDGPNQWRYCQAIAGILLFSRLSELTLVRLELTPLGPPIRAPEEPCNLHLQVHEIAFAPL